MNDEGRYFQIMKDYESFLGIKLINQQVHQLRQAKSQQSNLDAQNSRSGGTGGLSSGMRSSDFYSSGSDRMGSIENSKIGTRNAANKTGDFQQEGGIYNNNSIEQKLVDIEGSAMESINSVNSKGQSLKYSGGNNRENSKDIEQMQQQMQDEDDNIQQDVKEEVENMNKFNLANLNLKRNRKAEVRVKGIKREKASAEEQNNSESEDEKEVKESDEVEKSEMRQKIRMINA